MPVGEEVIFNRDSRGKVINYLAGDGWRSIKIEEPNNFDSIFEVKIPFNAWSQNYSSHSRII
jgi:hypothetical protein